MKTNRPSRLWAWVALGASLGLLPLKAQYPTIKIEGLFGAEHWVWIEGEYNKNRSANSVFLEQQPPWSLLSGYMENGPANVWDKTTGTVSPITWDLYIPADMQNPGLYAKALLSPSGPLGLTINIDGSKVSEEGLQMYKRGHGGIPADWLGMNSTSNNRANLSPISAGAHEIEFVSNTWGWKWDGFLIYDGTPDIRQVANNGTGRYWLQNPGSADSPLLDFIATPLITVEGLSEGNVVLYFLNGELYTPGTPIGAGLNYELVIAVFESSDPNSQRLAFAGANFSIIPEPGTYALVLAGMIGVATMVLVRRRKVIQK